MYIPCIFLLSLQVYGFESIRVKFYDCFLLIVNVFFLLSMLFTNGFCKTKVKKKEGFSGMPQEEEDFLQVISYFCLHGS